MADLDGVAVDIGLHATSPTLIDAEIAGVRRRYTVAIDAAETVVDVDSALGGSSYSIVARFPDPAAVVTAGSLVAPMPGNVVRVLVEAGARWSKGNRWSCSRR